MDQQQQADTDFDKAKYHLFYEQNLKQLYQQVYPICLEDCQRN